MTVPKHRCSHCGESAAIVRRGYGGYMTSQAVDLLWHVPGWLLARLLVCVQAVPLVQERSILGHVICLVAWIQWWSVYVSRAMGEDTLCIYGDLNYPVG